MHTFFLRSIILCGALFIFSCTATKKTTQVVAHIRSLQYLDTYIIPYNYEYKNTVVGGLSGIDYDVVNDLYYFICDDRSDKSPARFYTAKIFLNNTGIDSVLFTDVKNLLQPNGSVYPGIKEDKFKTPDPESIRYNAKKAYLLWSSEGERIIQNDTVLIDPALIFIKPNGTYKDSFSIPENLKIQPIEKGPRRNGVLEGLSFADNYRSLYVSVEEPLYEDGPRADVFDNNAFIRIIKYNVRTKKGTAQYAYKLGPVAYKPKSETGFTINGVPEILSLVNNELLVIERSFSTGRIPCTIKIFIADLKDATDVTNTTLKNNSSFVAARKKLLLNMDDLGIYTDNIEGVTFGPTLPNGHKTLLFIADNNFNMVQKTQLLLFEILEN